MWTIPSGHIDKGQTAVEVVIIEVKEAGITIMPEGPRACMHITYLMCTQIITC
jgi:hypothetical protein